MEVGSDNGRKAFEYAPSLSQNKCQNVGQSTHNSTTAPAEYDVTSAMLTTFPLHKLLHQKLNTDAVYSQL